MNEENLQEDRNAKLYIFMLSIILLVFFVGYAAKKLLPNIDDATLVSLDTLKVSFAERVQLVHTYWINNGKQSNQYLDVDDENFNKIRVSYNVNKEGWPIDSHFVRGRNNLGKNECERLWEGIILKDVYRHDGIVKLNTYKSEKTCKYVINDEALIYSMLDGSVKIVSNE